MKPTTRIYLYKILGEYFLTPQDALSYARNHGLEGPVVMRPVLMGRCE